MATLRVRIYNVRFGDAIFITVPEQVNGNTVTLNFLIDVGNAASTAGGVDPLFVPVVQDILKELGGKPLDLYLMTHEHMDHVQGLAYVESNWKDSGTLKDRLAPRFAWLTSSSDPDYGKKFPKAKEQKKLAMGLAGAIEKFVGMAPQAVPSWVMGLMAINSRSTDEDVQYLQSLNPKPSYVDRETVLDGLHPFTETKLEIWAPEADTSSYYGRFQPMALDSGGPLADDGSTSSTALPLPPEGVDASMFYDLVQMRQSGYSDNLLAIDKAANNTSVVLCLEWRGWSMLFTGDAELRSWQFMDKFNKLRPVDFLKVGHHGSQNATPPPELLDKILPKDGKVRYAAVSTYPAEDSPAADFVYNNVPDDQTLKELRSRAQLTSTFGLPDGGYIDYLFDDQAHTVTVNKSSA
jgi:hypothetical protein